MGGYDSDGGMDSDDEPEKKKPRKPGADGAAGGGGGGDGSDDEKPRNKQAAKREAQAREKMKLNNEMVKIDSVRWRGKILVAASTADPLSLHLSLPPPSS